MAEPLQSIATHSVASIVLLVVAILLFRTASGLVNSRFLRHIGYSVALNVLFRLGYVIYLLLVEAVTQLGPPDSEKTKYALDVLHSAWHSIDIAISLLSSFFLILAWSLLKNYPSEAVNRSVYTGLVSIIGGANIVVLLELANFAEQHKKYAWNILDGVDISAATVAIGLVGFQIYRTMEPLLKSRSSHVFRVTVPFMTVILYTIWAILQPLYPWLHDLRWYSVALLIGGISSQSMTIILCSHAMEQKPHPQASMGAASH